MSDQENRNPHNMAIRRSPVRSRNLETSRTSQSNRNMRTRSHSPRVLSRNQRNTIKSRRSRLRPYMAMGLESSHFRRHRQIPSKVTSQFHDALP